MLLKEVPATQKSYRVEMLYKHNQVCALSTLAFLSHTCANVRRIVAGGWPRLTLIVRVILIYPTKTLHKYDYCVEGVVETSPAPPDGVVAGAFLLSGAKSALSL